MCSTVRWRYKPRAAAGIKKAGGRQYVLKCLAVQVYAVGFLRDKQIENCGFHHLMLLTLQRTVRITSDFIFFSPTLSLTPWQTIKLYFWLPAYLCLKK